MSRNRLVKSFLRLTFLFRFYTMVLKGRECEDSSWNSRATDEELGTDSGLISSLPHRKTSNCIVSHYELQRVILHNNRQARIVNTLS